jgi:hypothetical protein
MRVPPVRPKPLVAEPPMPTRGTPPRVAGSRAAERHAARSLDIRRLVEQHRQLDAAVPELREARRSSIPRIQG